VKLDGVAVTPAGRPLTKTVIVPENPLRAVAERLTGCWLPDVRLRFATFAEIEKSAVLPPPPPPEVAGFATQPQIDVAERAMASQKNRICRGISIRSVVTL
jgi:hypothetical protein